MRRTRAEKRAEAAEEVCKAMRCYFSTRVIDVDEKQRYANIALGWLSRWMDSTGKRVKYQEPKPLPVER